MCSKYAGTVDFSWNNNVFLNMSADEYSGCAPDIGSFEYESTDCGDFVIGDINLDGFINVLDIVLLVNAILLGEFSDINDINQDGQNNVIDIVILVSIVLEG